MLFQVLSNLMLKNSLTYYFKLGRTILTLSLKIIIKVVSITDSDYENLFSYNINKLVYNLFIIYQSISFNHITV